jgi:hypothetical protein
MPENIKLPNPPTAECGVCGEVFQQFFMSSKCPKCGAKYLACGVCENRGQIEEFCGKCLRGEHFVLAEANEDGIVEDWP